MITTGEGGSLSTNNKKIFIVDNNYFAKSESKAKIVDGIKGKALKFSTDIDYLKLEKVPNFETNDSFSGSFWIILYIKLNLDLFLNDLVIFFLNQNVTLNDIYMLF